MSDMSLEAWAEEEKRRVDRFVVWFREQRSFDDPENWPLNMEAGQWDEAYMMFDDPDAPEGTR